jgi:hypothetical protein
MKDDGISFNNEVGKELHINIEEDWVYISERDRGSIDPSNDHKTITPS